MYNLTYGFYAATGLIHTPVLLTIDNTIINNATVIAGWERNGYYGFTIAMPDDFQGFVSFVANDGTDSAIFAINPAEVEYSDVATSSVRSIGKGNIQYPVTVLSAQNLPISDVSVWITSDKVGTNIVAGILTTDFNGQCTFLLDAGSYYLWRRHQIFGFQNPQRIVTNG